DEHARPRHPIFFFARDLAIGKISGFDRYKVDRPIEFDHDIETSDFPASNEVCQAFRDYVAKDPNWKSLLPLVDHNRAFVDSQVRFSLAMAACGVCNGQQVITREEPRGAKAIEVA